MHTDSQNTTNRPPYVRFGKFRHVTLGSVLTVMVLLMMSACSDDDDMEQQVESQADKPTEAAVVNMPPTQWQGQYLPQPYVAPPVRQPRVAAPVTGNPWAVQTQPQSYGQRPYQQWGQPQSRPQQYVQPQYAQPQYVQPQYAQQQQAQQQYVQPQYVQPQYVQPQYVQPQYVQPQYGQPQYGQPQYGQPQYGQPQYRPLEPETAVETPRAPAVQQPVQSYQPVAPYNRLSGSSFGTPGYPYGGGAYPGSYGSGLYGAPAGIYAPAWPGHW